MAPVGFYHLTRTSLIQALPRLLMRTLDLGQRAVVRCPSEDSVAKLGKALWETPEADWLPHGSAQDGDPDLQPIWLAADDDAPNGGRFLFLVEGASGERIGAFERVFDLFDGNDPDIVAAARLRWKIMKDAGHELTYWQQGGHGWERKV